MNNQNQNFAKSAQGVIDLLGVDDVSVVKSRRRLLLKGLGKSAAAVAAVSVPVKGMATWSPEVKICKKKNTNLDYHCSVSGMNSAAISLQGQTPVVCNGHSKDHYKADCLNGTSCWPSGVVPKSTLCKDVFTSCSNVKCNNLSATLKQVCLGANITGLPSGCTLDDLQTWVAAYLNANKFYGVGTFPYSGWDVKQQFTHTEKATYLAFHRDYLQSKNP